MRIGFARIASQGSRLTKTVAATFALMMGASSAFAQSGSDVGGEANPKLPDLSAVRFLNDAIDGHSLLLIGIGFCVLGLGFGLAIYTRLKNLPSPVSVPPEPTPTTTASTSCRICSQISGPVVRSCARGFAGFPNWFT